MNARKTTQYRPDRVSPPGHSLREALESMGISQFELAQRSGETPKYISDLINAKALISPEFALQLESILGVPSQFWIKREKRYQENNTEPYPAIGRL